jgi:DNA-binding transcriptional LysR family regulator
MLNPQWLRTFSVLVEEGHFTRTADRLHLTQAAVSQHIQHLEKQLGRLFIRRPRQLELMPAGEALLEYCREMDQVDKRFRLRLAAHGGQQGEISLISPGSIGLMLYPRLLDYQAANPGLVIRHQFAPDQDVLEAVLQNRHELGLLTRKPDDARLVCTLFAREPLELVVPAGTQVRGWDDLVRLGFIEHPDGRAMANRLLSRLFPANPGVASLPCHGFINQIGLILEPVARGLGFSVVPRYARQAYAKQEALQVVNCDAPVMDSLWLIHRAEWPLSERARHAMAYLRSHMDM